MFKKLMVLIAAVVFTSSICAQVLDRDISITIRPHTANTITTEYDVTPYGIKLGGLTTITHRNYSTLDATHLFTLPTANTSVDTSMVYRIPKNHNMTFAYRTTNGDSCEIVLHQANNQGSEEIQKNGATGESMLGKPLIADFFPTDTIAFSGTEGYVKHDFDTKASSPWFMVTFKNASLVDSIAIRATATFTQDKY